MNLLIAIALANAIQDKPELLSKADLPKAAECVICAFNGSDHGLEKPAAGVKYKGKSYFFCNTKEFETFRGNPEAYMPPTLPRPMPSFEIKAVDGTLWNAKAMEGKVVLIDWWATWCKPCIAMFPKVDKLREQYASKGFEVLSVSIDEEKKAFDSFVGKRNFANPVLHDGEGQWQKWNIAVIPAMYLVKDGQVVDQWVGKVDEKKIAAAVQKHLSAQ